MPKAAQVLEAIIELRVENLYDLESENWCFVVPSLGIIGGAQTREEAEQQAIDAITFTLESENDAAAPPEGEVRYLHLVVQR